MVTYHATAVSPHEIERQATDLYKEGFYCCEAVVSTIRDCFEADIPDEVIAMSSAMGVGIGKSGCICGALNGGLMALGLFMGRTAPTGPADPTSVRCMEMGAQLHDWFKKATAKNATCCRILTRGFDMGAGDHKPQCWAFTGMVAGKVAEMLCEELDVENTDGTPIEGLSAPILPAR